MGNADGEDDDCCEEGCSHGSGGHTADSSGGRGHRHGNGHAHGHARANVEGSERGDKGLCGQENAIGPGHGHESGHNHGRSHESAAPSAQVTEVAAVKVPVRRMCTACCGHASAEECKSSGCMPHEMVKTRLNVRNICCNAEVKLIDKILRPMKGVEDVMTSAVTKMVIVTHCPVECCAPPELLVDRLNAANLGASLLARDGADQAKTLTGTEWLRKHFQETHAATTVLLFLAAVVLQVGGRSEHRGVYFAAAGFGALPIFRAACRSLLHLQIDISALLSCVVLGALALGDLLEAALLVTLFALAELVEHWAMAWISRALNAAMQLSVTRTATMAQSGEVVPVSDLQSGDVIALRAGEECPVDGLVVKGGASFSEAALTGEAVPVEKRKGSTVSSGSLLLGGYVEVQLTAPANESTLAKLQEEVAIAQAMGGQTQQLVDRVARLLLPAVFVVACTNAVGGSLITGTSFWPWLHRSLVLLVLCCPCALVLAAPIPTTCAIAAAAGHGVLIKRPDVIENLAKVRALALDKTGTLTRGEFSVVAVEDLAGRRQARSGEEREAALRCVAAVEARSAHPLAAAIVSSVVGCAAEAFEAGGLPEVRKFKNIEGVGIQGQVSSGTSFVSVLAGNAKVLEEVAVTDADRQHFEAFQRAHALDTVLAVALDGALEFAIALNDTLRPSAKGTTDELRRLGCSVAMLTGDAALAATPVAQSLGIHEFRSSMLPSEKQAWVVASEKSGARTLMLGDGINDANALAAASVGVAMGEGCAALAARSADICIMSNDLMLLPQSINLCRYARKLVKLNIALVAFIKVATIVLALLGLLPLWLAVLVDVGSLILVLLVSVSVLRYPCWASLEEEEDNPEGDEGV